MHIKSYIFERIYIIPLIDLSFYTSDITLNMLLQMCIHTIVYLHISYFNFFVLYATKSRKRPFWNFALEKRKKHAAADPNQTQFWSPLPPLRTNHYYFVFLIFKRTRMRTPGSWVALTSGQPLDCQALTVVKARLSPCLIRPLTNPSAEGSPPRARLKALLHVRRTALLLCYFST